MRASKLGRFLVTHGVVILGVSLVLLLMVISPGSAAEGGQALVPENSTNWGLMAAAVAVGLGCIAAAIAVGLIGTAAMGTMGERPELFGRLLIFVGLAEGIAIYGLIIAIMILGKLRPLWLLAPNHCGSDFSRLGPSSSPWKILRGRWSAL